jgi:[citrate (pro-3S)-lyase] ligase
MAPVVTRLANPRDVSDARKLIESQGLRFEERLDDLVGVLENGRLLAAGARDGYVLKMLAIRTEEQGGALLGQLLGELVRLGAAAHEPSLLVFTKPESAVIFEQHGFRPLVTDGAVALLELGPGLGAYLQEHRAILRPGRNGAIVVNANPFTLGHLHLAETAASRVDALYLFVVREDRSMFPFEARFRLAREATAHMPNVFVLSTSRYAVSAATFPSYFLKSLDDRSLLQMETDLRLFGRRIAPYFSVSTRFVGEEPLCPMTAAYNRRMAELLPEYGIALVEIPRLALGGEIVSATTVRDDIARGRLEAAARLVPGPTLRYLQSAEGEAIARRLADAREGRL